MNKAAAKRVRTHHEMLAPEMAPVAARFYVLLFERSPALTAVFASDGAQRERQFVAALATVAKNLDRLDVLEEPLMQLGERHPERGVLPEHYPLVRDVLIVVLAEHSGERWSEQLENDWFVGLSRVCEALLKGALRGAERRALGARPSHGGGVQPVVRPISNSNRARRD